MCTVLDFILSNFVDMKHIFLLSVFIPIHFWQLSELRCVSFLEAYKVMMLDVTENKYFNVYTSIVSMIQFLYTIIHTISIVIYDTCICTSSSHIMMLIKVFPELVLPTDEHTICTPFIKGNNTSYTGFIQQEEKLSFFQGYHRLTV